MCKEMVKSDSEKFKKQEILKKHGYEILHQYEQTERLKDLEINRLEAVLKYKKQYV